jgi:PAS domain S-box-containing protein
VIDSERRFRLIVEGVTDYAIFLLDPDGKITDWNVGAERIKGYSGEEVIGRPFSIFYLPEDAAAGMPGRALETARTEGRYGAEGWRVRKDGSRFWASVVLDAIRDEAGELIGFAKITRDVTEQRETRLRLEEAREQLFQSQKMEALGQLTGGLAHDFNNLLTAVMGGIDLALRHQNDAARVTQLLESVRAAADRGAGLTKQLLSFARRQPVEATLVDLGQRLPVSIGMLRHSLTPDIELVVEMSDQLWAVSVDAGQLELALFNLVFNARDAMPAGGTLRVSARNVSLDGEVDGLVGEHVAISIADTGTGIAPETLDRVFEPFFTTKRFGQGTGLGLSQVYGFARQSQGAVTIESTVGQGTTVTLYLPGSGGHKPAFEPASSGASVLIVEDDPVVAEFAAALVSDMGCRTHVVHSGGEAMKALAQGPFDAVFTDVIMPGGMTGIELAKKIRSRFPELPVLVTTGYSEQALAHDAEFPILPKPYNFSDLCSAFEALLPDRGLAAARSDAAGAGGGGLHGPA